MIISSVWEDPSREERSILAFTKQAQLISGQANKIWMMRPLLIFKLPTIAKLFFGKGKNKTLLCKGKVPSMHGDGLQIKRLIPCQYATNQCAFPCDTSSQTGYFAWLSWFLPPVISKAYCFGDCIQTTEITLVGEMVVKKKPRYVTSDVTQLFLCIFKAVSCLLTNWVKLAWRERANRFLLFKMFHIHDLG